ncbi:MAG: DEAD/DEAH box helicase [Campylobacterota bacterium]|nr:DEAD/DEAH box helicase [Campylobacterota bacterium]
MPFSSLKLSSAILKALEERGYQAPTPIQKELIPTIMGGRDLLASAQTGTGKTAGFVLPVMQMIMQKKEQQPNRDESTSIAVRALILVPTRELAKQVAEHTEAYSRYLSLKSTAIYGGAPIAAQARRLAEGVDIVVGTPGRVLEHLGENNLDLKSVDYFILDEADTILDMGFLREVSRIIYSLKSKRQNILISATLPHAVKTLSLELLHRPIEIEIATMGSSAALVRQILHPVEMERKLELLSYLIGSQNYPQVLVFVRKKAQADEVTAELIASGLKTAVIHGDKTSGNRSRALSDFKERKIRVLVATDIAARGLDIKELDVVINYDIPHVTQDFIHRIGRTGRAGREGLAITLSSADESVALRSVERMMGRSIPIEVIPGYAPPVQAERRGARKNPNAKKPKTAGAFGKKKTATVTKKRKTTKRDGYQSNSKPIAKSDKGSGRGGRR